MVTAPAAMFGKSRGTKKSDSFFPASSARAAASPIDPMPNTTLTARRAASPPRQPASASATVSRAAASARPMNRLWSRPHGTSTPSQTGAARYSAPRKATRCAFDAPAPGTPAHVVFVVPPNGLTQPAPVTNAPHATGGGAPARTAPTCN